MEIGIHSRICYCPTSVWCFPNFTYSKVEKFPSSGGRRNNVSRSIKDCRNLLLLQMVETEPRNIFDLSSFTDNANVNLGFLSWICHLFAWQCSILFSNYIIHFGEHVLVVLLFLIHIKFHAIRNLPMSLVKEVSSFCKITFH